MAETMIFGQMVKDRKQFQGTQRLMRGLLAQSCGKPRQSKKYMRFSGKIYKDGEFWLAEIPILDAMTQGHTKKEAYKMALDMIESMVNKEGFHVELYKGENGIFEIGSSDSRSLISLLLQRKRQLSGLSLSEVASRLGLSSRNSYARYEKGQTVPTIGKLGELLRAVDPNADIVINVRP